MGRVTHLRGQQNGAYIQAAMDKLRQRYRGNKQILIKLLRLRAVNSIPTDTIVRRYKRGLENFFSLYMPPIDNWGLYDNSGNSLI